MTVSVVLYAGLLAVMLVVVSLTGDGAYSCDRNCGPVADALAYAKPWPAIAAGTICLLVGGLVAQRLPRGRKRVRAT